LVAGVGLGFRLTALDVSAYGCIDGEDVGLKSEGKGIHLLGRPAECPCVKDVLQLVPRDHVGVVVARPSQVELQMAESLVGTESFSCALACSASLRNAMWSSRPS